MKREIYLWPYGLNDDIHVWGHSLCEPVDDVLLFIVTKRELRDMGFGC